MSGYISVGFIHGYYLSTATRGHTSEININNN